MKKIIIAILLIVVPRMTFAADYFQKNLSYGIKSNQEVTKVQKFLIDQGHNLKVTGNFDKSTKLKVTEYQKKNKINPANGTWNIKTRMVANKAYNKANTQAVGTTTIVSKPAGPNGVLVDGSPYKVLSPEEQQKKADEIVKKYNEGAKSEADRLSADKLLSECTNKRVKLLADMETENLEYLRLKVYWGAPYGIAPTVSAKQNEDNHTHALNAFKLRYLQDKQGCGGLYEPIPVLDNQ